MILPLLNRQTNPRIRALAKPKLIPGVKTCSKQFPGSDARAGRIDQAGSLMAFGSVVRGTGYLASQPMREIKTATAPPEGSAVIARLEANAVYSISDTKRPVVMRPGTDVIETAAGSPPARIVSVPLPSTSTKSDVSEK